MSKNSKIEWTDHTFNPFIGCTKVSPGCDNCYAEAMMDHRMHKVVWGPKGERVRTSAANWNLPKRWDAQHEAFFNEHGRRQRVFCASLADVFDNAVPEQWRADLFELIEATPHLDWILLTKRVGNVGNMLPVPFDFDRHFPNVWLGITVVNQAEADRDMPKLLAVPAAKRFLSMEPLLEHVNLAQAGALWSDLNNNIIDAAAHGKRGIDWVIVGGESGPNARPMHPDWASSLRDQCNAASVPFFFKQHGEWTHAHVRPSETPGRYALAPRTFGGPITQIDHYPRQFTCFGSTVLERVGKKAAGRLLDGREWNEVPV